MKVVLIAPPWLPIPPPSYGGTEAVIDRLARGLHASGHDVTLIAHPDSSCPVPSVSVIDNADTAFIGVCSREVCHGIGAYGLAADYGADVIHDHSLAGPLVGAPRATRPIVVTNHGPFDRAVTTILG